MATSSPVLGLRPTPRFRDLTTKTPKPRSSILAPLVSASFIEWNSASTACSAFIFGTPVLSATRLIISSLITTRSLSFLSHWGSTTRLGYKAGQDDREARQTLSRNAQN